VADHSTISQDGSRLGKYAIYILLALVCVYYLIPLFVMVATSFKTLDEIRNGNLISLPMQPTLAAWQEAWATACIGVRCEGMSVYFWNSFRFVVPAVLLSTLLGAFNGYVLTMWRFRGSDLFFSALMIGCFIPFQVILLPMARTLGLFGIANSVTGLIFVHVVYGVAFTTLFSATTTFQYPMNWSRLRRLMVPDFYGFFGELFCQFQRRSWWSPSFGNSPKSGMTFCSAWCFHPVINSQSPWR